jgi:hypothetical protein
MSDVWLKKYYDLAWRKRLNPSIVYDGKSFAVVRVTDESKIGFVLLQKTGRHGVTYAESLHEGVPQAADFIKMKEALKKADGV